jgi:hypothetical protein
VNVSQEIFPSSNKVVRNSLPNQRKTPQQTADCENLKLWLLKNISKEFSLNSKKFSVPD